MFDFLENAWTLYYSTYTILGNFITKLSYFEPYSPLYIKTAKNKGLSLNSQQSPFSASPLTLLLTYYSYYHDGDCFAAAIPVDFAWPRTATTVCFRHCC